MSKDDLRPGMVVETNDGNKYLVAVLAGKTILTGLGGWLDLKDYGQDLKMKEKDFYGKFAISNVYEVKRPLGMNRMFDDKNLTLIWDREQETVWSKVPVDTKVLCRAHDINDWFKRHFAKYKDGRVYVFSNGKDSFTGTDSFTSHEDYEAWDMTVLYEGNEHLAGEESKPCQVTQQ